MNIIFNGWCSIINGMNFYVPPKLVAWHWTIFLDQINLAKIFWVYNAIHQSVLIGGYLSYILCGYLSHILYVVIRVIFSKYNSVFWLLNPERIQELIHGHYFILEAKFTFDWFCYHLQWMHTGTCVLQFSRMSCIV